MKTVYLPKEISMLFANAHGNFSAIIGKPSDDEVQRLCRQKLAALQNIDLGGGTDTIGLILYKDDHKAANRGHMFDQSDRTLEAYDPYIRDNDKTSSTYAKKNMVPQA